MGAVELVLLSTSLVAALDGVAALDDEPEAEVPFSVAYKSEKKSCEIT